MPLPKELPLLSGGSSKGFPYQSRPKTARRLTASDIKARSSSSSLDWIDGPDTDAA